jgi:hypothetical protein
MSSIITGTKLTKLLCLVLGEQKTKDKNKQIRFFIKTNKQPIHIKVAYKKAVLNLDFDIIKEFANSKEQLVFSQNMYDVLKPLFKREYRTNDKIGKTITAKEFVQIYLKMVKSQCKNFSYQLFSPPEIYLGGTTFIGGTK